MRETQTTNYVYSTLYIVIKLGILRPACFCGLCVCVSACTLALCAIMCRKYIIGLRSGLRARAWAHMFRWHLALCVSQWDFELVGILFSPHVCARTHTYMYTHIQDRKPNGIYMHGFFVIHVRRVWCTICAAVSLARSIWILWIAC